MPKKSIHLLQKSIFSLLLLICAYHSFAQKTVTGRIINTGDRQPVPGATVQVRNTNIITQTETNGDFSVRVPADSSTLIITVVGYEQMELPTTGKSNLGDIGLKSSTATLNDVVVTGTQRSEKKI